MARERLPSLVLVVSLVLATRVMGLSLVLPSLPTYALGLVPEGDAWAPALAGLAFSGYALAMAALQIPFGILSDRWGRRPALALGLAISAAGSFAAAWAPTIGWLIAARFLQGAGAVNGVALALLGEETPPERRTTAVAIAGAVVGIGFTGGVVVGALLAPVLDVPGLFVLNGVVVVANLLFVLAVVAPKPPHDRTARWRDVLTGSARPRVLALDAAQLATNFALHAVLFAFPLVALARLGSERSASFALAAAVVAGGVVMFAGARAADKGRATPVARAGAVALGVGAAAVAVAPTAGVLVVAGVVFFAGQSVLAALLPSTLAREAPPEARGGAQSGMQLAGSAGVAAGGLAGAAAIGAPAALAVAALAAGALALGAWEWSRRA